MATDRPQPAVEEFVGNWKGRTLSERQGSHVHFIELCGVLGVAYPHQNPADDDDYCFDALTTTAGSGAYRDAMRRRGRPGPDAPAPVDEGPTLFGDDPDAETEAPPSRIVPAQREGHGFADVWKREQRHAV